MKFIALDVNIGDSFILEVDDQLYVIDGGQSEHGIVSKLSKNNIKNINVLICTHYDSDHLNGIIGIVKSRTIHINELWLPDIFGDIALTMSSNVDLILKCYDDSIFNEIDQKKSISNYQEKHRFNQSEMNTNNSYELINTENLSYCYEILNYHCFHLQIKPYITQKILKKIIRLVIESIKSGAHIRWLKYIEIEEKNKISANYDIFATNSYETSIQPYCMNQFILALYCLTRINKESLVFLYESKRYPNVLFTADSDFGFLKNNNISLKNNSIVTAPHHGSGENKNVYKIITGNDLIYVRSDRSQIARPCYEYVKLTRKYCTICRNKGLKQAVILEYNGQWNTKNNSCYC